MIHFEGDRSFTLPVADVYAKLGDASFLLSCLKDVEQVLETGVDRAQWKLRPRFSFIRTTLDITMDIVERVPTTSVKVKLYSKGIGASTTVISEMKFAQKDTATAVHWVADVTELTGLLKLVPKVLISSSAGKVIEETWAEIDKKLNSATGEKSVTCS
jgi:carbon monoxide dehydrogenase subunit G